MPLPVLTSVATGYSDAVGCAYRLSTDQLLIADAGAGSISAVTAHTFVQSVLGTGYNAPSDIVLCADNLTAYVTENPGTLLRVTLSSANRADATVIASGLNGVDQIALDEAHGVAYVAESTGSTLQKIDLSTEIATTAATAVFAPRGVVVTSDGRYAYVSDDAGNITRFDFATDTHAVVASGLDAPRHLTWADATQSAILFPQRNPNGRVSRLDLTASPPSVTTIVEPTPSDPYSIAVLSPEKFLLASAQTISLVDCSAFDETGPVLLGIGLVPADDVHLPNGYADTSADPTYFFQVFDCPFGGTLPLLINWKFARETLHATKYKVTIQSAGGPAVEVHQPFGDYLWNGGTERFELQTTVPTDGYYPLRDSTQIWLNEWLGLLLDTSGQPNNLNTIGIQLFDDTNTEIGAATDEGRYAAVMIDNTGPTARLETIYHGGDPNAPVDACAIVDSPPSTFTFRITASAPRHLRGWSLGVDWGDNKSAGIAADDYNAHVSPSRIWTGLTSEVVPPSPWDAAVEGDSSSTHCAHTFYLQAWDRVINGWGYIHGTAGYHKSITLML